jgi:hypothetical protein
LHFKLGLSDPLERRPADLACGYRFIIAAANRETLSSSDRPRDVIRDSFLLVFFLLPTIVLVVAAPWREGFGTL